VPASLCERLGHAADSRLLIVNADDFGMCHAENRATVDGLEAGIYTSSTIMVPCPWFAEAAAYGGTRPSADLGVHLTQTSEWAALKWGPVAGRDAVPSLVDERGFFHPDVPAVYARATLEDVERECRAQIDQALAAGVDVTHLDSHMGTMQYDASYHELYVRLAAEYRVPLRMVPRRMLEGPGSGFERTLALIDEHGVLGPDWFHIGGPPAPEATAAYWNEFFENQPPGVSEIYIHAGYGDAELRACCPAWEQRVADHEFFSSAATQERLRSLGIVLVGYRALREAQRAA
jgi:chitin disaccharide deacetylase